MRFSAMIFAVSTAVFLSVYSISYWQLSIMGLLIGIQISLPSLSTALLFTIANCSPSYSPLFSPSSIPRYGSVLPNYVAFFVSTSFNVASTSLKNLLSTTLLNSFLNSSFSSQGKVPYFVEILVSILSCHWIVQPISALFSRQIFHSCFILIC